jgi:hypothetical protein
MNPAGSGSMESGDLAMKKNWRSELPRDRVCSISVSFSRTSRHTESPPCLIGPAPSNYCRDSVARVDNRRPGLENAVTWLEPSSFCF